ncbi:MAG: Nitroreductase, partial [Candidatus Roizmanbacteria bacterium GW2011_GWC2_41_7]
LKIVNFALQGSLNGFVVHGMAGFDYARARADLEIPDDFDVEAMIIQSSPRTSSLITGFNSLSPNLTSSYCARGKLSSFEIDSARFFD